MPSLVAGYNYDIFISYRQKDNQYDGWVSEFVTNLTKELEATFKDSVTIYFDENPSTGLLETHHVNKSLEDKLRCVIFIPILSQTYCDPRSYAWSHEFLPFRDLAMASEEGLTVKLKSGNVGSRILPVRIHDLDEHDRQLFEKESGGPLRSVDFIFRGPGVNRPLRAKDDELTSSAQKALYRDQVNKVANAVKEIIVSRKTPGAHQTSAVPVNESTRADPFGGFKKKIILRPALVGLVLVAAALIYWFSFRHKPTQQTVEKSIAVLPFEDVSANHDQEWFGDGMTGEIITSLSQVSGLRVIGRTSSFFFKGKDISIRDIGDRLKVEYILTGSVHREGESIRVSAALELVTDGTQIWSRKFDRVTRDNLRVQDEIAMEVVKYLTGKILPSPGKQLGDSLSMLFMQGDYFLFRNEPQKAREVFQRALEIDSTSARAIVGIGQAYAVSAANTDMPWTEFIPKLREYCQKALRFDPDEMNANANLAWITYAYDRDYAEAGRQLEVLIEKHPQSIIVLDTYSALRQILGDYTKSIEVAEQMKRSDPLDPRGYGVGAAALIHLDRLDEAYAELEIALNLNPKNTENLALLGAIRLMQKRPEDALFLWKADDCMPCRIYSAMAHYSMGRVEKSHELLKWSEENLANGFPSFIALSYAYIGDEERAYYWLQKSVDAMDYVLVLNINSVWFDKMRNTPRFRSILKQLNLPATR